MRFACCLRLLHKTDDKRLVSADAGGHWFCVTPTSNESGEQFVGRMYLISGPPSGSITQVLQQSGLDLFGCRNPLDVGDNFGLTLAISYEVSVHVLLRWVVL